MPRRRRHPLRQFTCETEGCKDEGRTWLKRDTFCECRECGEEARHPLRQFTCETEGCEDEGRTWLKRDTFCECRECGEEARHPLRQFTCETEGCIYEGKTWPRRDTFCECRECGEEAELIRQGEEVFVFEFNCDCGNQYTVRCRWEDTAECYECGEPDNPPTRFLPRGFIASKTDNTHSCSRCGGHGDCPNLRGR